jgi:biopolymer transport protein ExbB/TolQ
MSCSQNAYASHHSHGGRCGGRMRWKPIELVAMILGFIFFFPVGLAILAWKIYQTKTAYAGDFSQFAQEKWGGFEQRSGMSQMKNAFGGGWMGTSGNSAFDDWRKTELERLDEERRKIFEAERAFNEYQEGLRKAKDREEFERFMNSRNANPTPDAGSGGN